MSRRFELYRFRDPSGGGGTGVVAQGTEYSNGWVSLAWLGQWPSMSVWPDIDSMLEVHGHLGASEVRWLDPDPDDDLRDQSARMTDVASVGP
jgi:hypothetical protein